MDANTVCSNTPSQFIQTVDIVYKIVVLFIAAVGIVVFFFRGYIKGYKSLKRIFQSLDKCIAKSTALMDKIVPRVLQGLEKKGFVAPNTLVEWTEILSARNYTITSPKKLNEFGQKILNDCSIKQIIDQNEFLFFDDLDSLSLKTALDVEEKSFYVLDKHKEETIFNSLKSYIYNNPNIDIYGCLFIGSIYLRDLYLAKHQELQ